MIGPLLTCFHVVMFTFSSARFQNTCKARTGWSTSNEILWKWASKLTKLAVDNEYWMAVFHAIRNFLANEIYSFSRLSIKQAAFLPRLAPQNQLLIQPLLLFPEWYFAQNVKLRSLNFKSISLKMLFSFAATFFSSFCYHFELIFSS